MTKQTKASPQTPEVSPLNPPKGDLEAQATNEVPNTETAKVEEINPQTPEEGLDAVQEEATDIETQKVDDSDLEQENDSEKQDNVHVLESRPNIPEPTILEEPEVDAVLQAKADELMKQNHVDKIYQTNDGYWFTSKQNAEMHAFKINSSVQVFFKSKVN